MKKQIKFNNFKPFGNKIQSFSKKPITLIYGPNSIGKSSLIHMLAYRDQLVKGDFSPNEIHCGDTISLDGFPTFVHKKNINNTITLTLDTEYNNATIETQIAQIDIGNNKKITKDVLTKYIIDNEVMIEAAYVDDEGYNITLNLMHPYMIQRLDEIKNNGGWTDEEFQKSLGKAETLTHLFKVEEYGFSFLKYSFIEKYDPDDFGAKIMAKEEINVAKERPFKWTSKDENAKISISKMKLIDGKTWYIDKFNKEAENDEDIKNWNYTVISMANIDFDDNTILSLNILLKQYAINMASILNLSAYHKSFKNNFEYIGPLRFYPERNSTHKEIRDNESIDSEKFWLFLQKYPELISKLNSWLSNEKLNTPYEIKIRKTYDLSNLFKLDMEEYTREDIEKYSTSKEELIFNDKRTNTLVHNREMGLGVTQILPIIGSTLFNKDHIIAIEQPELHLHPRIQAEIADEFIRSYKENKNEFLIETHSEHILLRIMKRMRQTAEKTNMENNILSLETDDVLSLTPDDVCILYVDNDGESTYIQELRLSTKGKLLDHWPNGFFEEGFKERFS